MNARQIAQNGFGMHDRWGDGGAHPFFALLCLLAIATAIALVVWLVVGRRPHTATVPPAPVGPMAAVQPSPTAAAEAILAERLARSEISPDDYRAMIAALREQQTPPTA